MNLKRLLVSPLFTLIFYACFTAIFYFAIPWILNGTIYMFRWDEGPYLYIFKQIVETGYVPSSLNYIGGISNYIYPNLYLLLASLLVSTTNSMNLQLASIALQGVLFVVLVVSSLLLHKILLLQKKDFLFAFIGGLLYLVLPVVSYRLFYLHATFYANFIGIMFLLGFFLFLQKYKSEERLIFLGISIFCYSLTLFTHQLVFMMATILLAIDVILEVIERRTLKAQIKEKFAFLVFLIVLNIGYIIKTPIALKILSILHIAKYNQFGQEVVTKSSAEALPQLVPDPVFYLALFAMGLIFVMREKKLYGLALFHLFLVSPLVLNPLHISLPANFRYDTFYVITLPVLVGYFISIITNSNLKILIMIYLFVVFGLQTTKILNGFTVDELNSLSKGLNTLQCHDTVSYFRIAPWIPVLSNSSVYYAHVDIYNAHQDKMNKAIRIFSNTENLAQRLDLMRKEKVDCLIYEKRFLVVDNIRVKGWEYWRYNDLYRVSKNYYEDKNLVIFKFSF